MPPVGPCGESWRMSCHRTYSGKATATSCSPGGTHAHIAYAFDLIDRIALLYVTNKKGGDNIKAALQDVVRRDHRLAGIGDIPGVRTALITGAIDAGGIGSNRYEAARKPAVGSPFRTEALRDSLRGVIATSAISHGVFSVARSRGTPGAAFNNSARVAQWTEEPPGHIAIAERHRRKRSLRIQKSDPGGPHKVARTDVE